MKDFDFTTEERTGHRTYTEHYKISPRSTHFDIDECDMDLVVRISSSSADGVANGGSWYTFDQLCGILRVLPEIIDTVADVHGFEIPEDLLED